VIGALTELKRWEATAADIESQLRELRSRKTVLRERLKSLELMLSSIHSVPEQEDIKNLQRFGGVR
jgi:hypothetical protein